MSFSVTEAFVKQFNATIMHLSQQKGSRLMPRVRNETQRGDSQFFERLGPVVAQKATTRHDDTPQIDTPHSRRRVTLSDFRHADLVSSLDKVRMLVDPTSDYAKTFLWAFGRAKDDELILSMDGDAFAGQEGATVVAHPNSQKITSVSGGAGVNLNVQALRKVKQLFDEADVDEDIPRHIAPNASAMNSLLGETEVTSSDFNVVKALVQGQLDTFLGLSFVRIKRLLTQSGLLNFNVNTGTVGSGAGDADGYKRIPAWAQDGMILSTAIEMKTRIAERPDKNFETQVWAEQSIGATRLEEVKVVMVLANQA